MFLLVPAEFDAVGDQFEFLLEFSSFMSELAQFDRLEFFWQEELPVESGLAEVQTARKLVHQ